ncbi:ATP synthase subunit d, mitochondrial-like [Galleria mellonella]|uniref:ATP synthase subunit d, mitochondrial n=1 Tax=Galleria mellonella TaxID=7137 RepID=A0A6J1WXA2_GALME|nr:ATP synthase subunit d, mitochondrial-like [Galleria mellonella]XP_052756614.1 ATP synthase subunit d, mitochondrial-like [Galleria mellonella]XP_052756615.1 ATP synthase subunit d, mitochondrial-like [Galleria mellonella]XP_052756616.1 ATP synthase subunit d, mitochondrial-like [Galleria mellonella]XP_052756617.1 ATP synthase subunit d, mitochondrial-like [Galleria mellonella]XP_052756618.1 ATP synthase subunit d, mitochondrial-like [Galleria mellonella]XP_052756619.1 ATP synthase subunit
MAKRFTKPSINWVEFEKRVPPGQKGKFLAFKTKSDSYLRRVEANPPEPPKINWEEYQKLVPVKGLVDKFKSQYESFKVAVPADTFSQAIDDQWKSLEPQIKAFCAEQQKQIDEANKELIRIKALPKFEEMTLEMYAEIYPDQALDPVNRPTFWPHDPEDQVGYKPSPKKEQQVAKAKK